jgi:hypothetical protein
MEKKNVRYEKPTLEHLDVVGQGSSSGPCAAGSGAGGACNPAGGNASGGCNTGTSGF